MLAAGLSLIVFLVFFVIGFAVVLLLRSRGPSAGEILTAPAFGIAALVIPTVALNQFGNLPVSRFAVPEVCLLVAGALFVIIRKRHLVPRGLLFIVAGVALFSYGLVGWPQFLHGFDWVGFSNDDMTNYALSADRLAAQGFFQRPPMVPDELHRGFTASYWFFYALNGVRAGADTLLALVVAMTRLRGFQAFMPFIVACHMSLVLTTSAMGWALRRRLRDVAFLGLLLGLSAALSVGMFYQLLAQEVGICLLVGIVAFVAVQGEQGVSRTPALNGVALGVLLAAQLLVYPESFPFSILLGAVLIILLRVRRVAGWRSLLAAIPSALLTTVLLTLSNSYTMLAFLRSSLAAGTASPHQGLVTEFPYYLVPSGLADLWGVIGLTQWHGEPLLSIGIVAGFLLTAAVTASAAYLFGRRGSPPASMLLIMMALAVALFARQVGFGLYKLAMYAQPFLLAVYAATAVGLGKKARITVSCLTFRTCRVAYPSN